VPACASVADNTAIFSVCFTAVGASGSVVPVNFATTSCPNPTPLAIMKKTTTIAGTTFRFNAGSVTIKAQNGPPTLAGAHLHFVAALQLVLLRLHRMVQLPPISGLTVPLHKILLRLLLVPTP
jgi:hypothetical protein